jgi:aryl-alcohol dehydrogenase-like predicted oxidoreductase
MTFGEDWGWGASPQECRRMYEAYRAAGGDFIDTADIYTDGSSERIVGDLVAAERGRVVVATKYTMSTDRADPNGGGNHRKHLVQALDASLKRLRLDYVDVLWVHAWDFLTPVDEVMRALDDQVRAGKVLYIGVSNTPAWVVAQANTLADARGWSPFVALQVDYSLVQRTPELELLPMAHALDLAVTPWGPLGSGVLSGKYDAAGAATGGEAARRPGAHRLTERALRTAAQLREVAAELHEPPAAVAVAWLLTRGPAPVIPILGARTVDQLRQDLRAADLTLPDEALRRLDEASAIELTFPQRFLQADDMRRSVHGDTFGAVADHRGRLPL